MRRQTGSALALAAAIIALAGCASSTPLASDSPDVTSDAPTATAATPTISAETVEPSTEATAAPSLGAMTLEQADGVTFLRHTGGDTDAIPHRTVFFVDDSGCLRADVESRGDGMFVALGPLYDVVDGAIVDADGATVAPFATAVTAEQESIGSVPETYASECGITGDDEVFGAAPVSRS